MMLIADSGSTKCDWVLIENQKSAINFKSAGFNPFFQKEPFILAELARSGMTEIAKRVSKVYFYGAGCSNTERNKVIKDALQKFFIHADISVEHDLAASVYAVYEGKPCIAAIAGTGSNSCYYDGKNISEAVPSLGYILGDEGSGSYFGKLLLKKYLYKQLPESITNLLTNEYKLSKENIFDAVYSQPGANVYLASFFKVYGEFKNDPFIRETVFSGMKDFLENHVCCFPESVSVKTHFVGSVGYIFEDVLRAAAGSLGIAIGKVIKQPIDGLVKYHLGNLE